MSEKELRREDAWIAQNVMGWKKREFKDEWDSEAQCHRSWTNYYGPEGEIAGDWPLYHTDSSDAMDLLKKCAEKCDQISITECAGTWCITEGDGNGEKDEYPEAEGPTLEHAICRFARKLFA